jgi:fatty-acyl-CoA synthase
MRHSVKERYMDNLIVRSPSAYGYPLLVKNILLSPIAYDPDREIVYGGVRLTYREFRERVARLASALLALGIKQGDTVAVMDWDSNRYLECYFAIPMIGAVLHTINVRLPAEQLAYTIDHAEDELILVNADFLPLLEAIRGRLDFVKKFVLMSDAAGAAPASGTIQFSGEYEALLAAAEPMAEFPDLNEDSRATTFYTTGTTGQPKGVYFSHRQLVLHTISALASLASAPGSMNFHREDVYMPITPMFHVHAWGIPYIATMLGVKQVYPGKYVPARLLKLIGDEGVTFSHCVPTILAMLLKEPSGAEVDLSRWKCIIGGSALPKAVCLEALSRGVDVFAGYGMSETCPVLSIARLTPEELALPEAEQVERRVRTGAPIAFAQIKVLSASGEEQPMDDRSSGEIVVRAPWLTQGYHKDHANSERLWAGGWLHSQDVAARDSTGSLRITDRLKDVIKVGGEWLSSLELEDILLAHPAIGEAAVVGRPDDKWGETPLAVVVLKAGAEASAHRVMEHLKGYIDRGIVPREALLSRVEFAASIPKTGVGKIDKKALREAYAK